MEWSNSPPPEYKGLLSTDVALRILGKAEDGRWDIQLNLSAPTPDDSKRAEQTQIDSIHDLFPHIPKNIAFNQAHEIICYCEFARLFVSERLADLPEPAVEMWQKIVATLVSHDRGVGSEIVDWVSDRSKYGSHRYPVSKLSFMSDLVDMCIVIENEFEASQ